MIKKSIINLQLIETQRLILEPLVNEHASKLFEGYCDPAIYDFIESEIPESVDWLRDEFKILEQREFTNKNGKHMLFYDWAVFSKKEGEYIGRSEFTIYDNGECNVAYVFFSKFWRKGYAFEAMKEALSFVIKQNNHLKFKIECDSLNVASICMAKKLGFKYVETKFNATKLKERMGHDHVFIYE